MNVRNPLISVITPTYNRAHVITRAINSILGQTFRDYEYIIIDDGSKDDTKSLINGIIETHPEGKRIQFHQHTVNRGQNAALNTGLSLAKGNYVAFLDSDDEWLPDMLQEQINQFQADKDVSCSYTWPGTYNSRGELVPGRKYSIKGYMYMEALTQGYICNPTTLMAKKECFDKLGGFKTEFVTCQDDDICLRLAKEFKFGLVPEIKAIIHDDAGNQTISNRTVYADDWYKLFNKYEKDILQYCGKETFARHLNKCAVLYMKIGNTGKAKEIIRRSMGYDKTVKAGMLRFINLLPSFISSRTVKLFYWLKWKVSV
jgi:glycosyltransferase involved in cell wall biosynthesis